MQRAIDKLEPFQRAISKAHLASAGVSIDSLENPDKPLIAIANSWNEVCPGHEPLRQLAAEVKKGILEAGGEPIEFNTIGMCDGVAQGHAGMRYCLPHREIIADSCEAMIVGEGCFDGVVYMGSCDKIVPAMLMAAARINLPAALVTAGPCYDEIKPSESKALRARFLRGEATEREVIEGTLKYYTGPGICPFLGTANTMGCLTEGLGMMLPNGALWPSSTSQRRFSARQTGAAVVELVRRGIKPSDIMTQGAIDNTVKLLASIGGSLNALIHLPALAHELGLECTWTQVAETTSHTPVVCNVVPNGDISCVNLYKAGGVPAVLKTIEGVSGLIMGMLKDGMRSSRRARVGALMMRPALRGLKSKMDYKSHGGAPLLGVNGAVVKAHGSSDARAIKNAVRQARSMLEGKVVEKIRDGLEALSAKE